MRNSLVAVLLLFLTACVTVYNPATQKNESYFIDEEQEIGIGKNICSDILRTKKTINDPALLQFVRHIGEKIARNSDRNYLTYHFYILDEKDLNAFALPGGYVFVNRGLLDKLNEDEIAFVLGHEIGHVCARHSVKRLQTALGINLLLSIGLRNPDYTTIRQAANIAYSISESGYSRQDELLADYLGAKYIYKSGYDPTASIRALQKLKAEEKGNFTIPFLRSHPETAERIKRLSQKIEEFKTP